MQTIGTIDRVLLVDDQAIVGEAVRRMIATQGDCEYRAVNDPAKAIAIAEEFRPTVILQDIEMPGMNGLDLVVQYRAHDATREVPVIMLTGKEDPAVKAEAFSRGASDYLVKLPHPVELVARIRHHSRGYRMQLERNAAFSALEASEAHMKAEINRAATYVRSLLDPPMEGAVHADWRFVPCEALGGDVFGFHWIDEDHLAMYVIDVSGHGVGPALMGVSAMNLIKSGSLERAQVLDPTRTLQALNAAFPMARHDGMYFTIWYGVWSPSSRRLRLASAGHPAALLATPAGAERKVERLRGPGMILGGMSGTVYRTIERTLPAGAQLYVVSDGTFEITLPSGEMWPVADFERHFTAPPAGTAAEDLAALLARARALRGATMLDDDFSIMRLDL